jgi:hypothetical protein
MSICCLSDANHIFKDDPFGLEHFDNPDVLKEEPVLGIGLCPRSLVGGGKTLTRWTAEHYQVPSSIPQRLEVRLRDVFNPLMQQFCTIVVMGVCHASVTVRLNCIENLYACERCPQRHSSRARKKIDADHAECFQIIIADPLLWPLVANKECFDR